MTHAQACAVIDLTGEGDADAGPQSSGLLPALAPETEPSAPGAACTAHQQHPPPTPPTVVLDLSGVSDEESDGGIVPEHHQDCNHYQQQQQQQQQQAAPASSSKRSASPTQPDAQQLAHLPKAARTASPNASPAQAGSQAQGGVPGQPHQLHSDRPAPAASHSAPPASLPRQLAQGDPARERQLEDLLSDTPFKLMKMEQLNNTHYNGHCCGADPSELVPHGRIQLAMSSNMYIDLTWLLERCPRLAQATEHLVVLHSSSDLGVQEIGSILKGGDPPLMSLGSKLTMHRSPLPYEYGTQHSKFLILQNPQGIRFIIHTANPLKGTSDLCAQAMWWQDFPLKDGRSPSTSDFEESFANYVCGLQLQAQEQDEILRAIRMHDFSSARAYLVPSVPGMHKGEAVYKYGHMRVRALLEKHLDAPPITLSSVSGTTSPKAKGMMPHFLQPKATKPKTSPPDASPEGIVVQPTSLGSTNKRWLLEDFGASLNAVKPQQPTFPLRISKPPPPSKLPEQAAYVVWPTCEEIRCSMGGWRSGGNVHATHKNMHADQSYLLRMLHRFSGEAACRKDVMPHMKSYVRFKGQRILYAIIGSHNLSKAAWGSPSAGSMHIRSYELSVLMLPELEAAYRRHRHYRFSITPEAAGQQQQQQQQQHNPAPPQQQQHHHHKQGGQSHNSSTPPLQFWTLNALLHPQRMQSSSSSSSSSSSGSGSGSSAPAPGQPSTSQASTPQATQPPNVHQQLPTDLSNCAFLPIPYPLPPTRYAEGDEPSTLAANAKDGIDMFAHHIDHLDVPLDGGDLSEALG